MSKEKDLKQMSLLEDSHANLSPLQEKEKEQTMIATSGMKLLELYPSKNPNGLLARTLRELLTSKTAWCSDRSTMTWKVKVSKCKVLLFQLAVSVRGIKEKEFGSSDVMYPTPTSQDHSRNTVPPSIGETRGMDLSMRVVADQIKMYPTPTVDCEEGGEQSKRVEQTKSGGFILRKKNKPNSTFGAKLSDAMLYLNRPKVGGKLNPHFLEFLMGYPMNWTKIEPIELNHLEIQSSHKSPLKSEKQSSMPKMMFRTPTAMDIGEDSFVYAAKILKGKVNRSSNERVQITLSTDVAMEYLKENPHLINQYDKPFMVRPKLPKKEDFIKYIRDNTSIKILTNNTDIPKTKIEHWFRKDNCFSYPTVKDWNKIKPFLKNIKFDEEMTYEKEEDWIQNN